MEETAVTSREKKALREFCLTSLEQKRKAEESKALKRQESQTIKTAREELDAWIRQQGTSRCFVIPKQRYKELEQELSQRGIPPVPCYVRLKKQTSDSTISSATVEESIQELTKGSLEAASSKGSTPLERLASAIVDCLRMNIRSTRESVQLSESLEKGYKHLDVPDMDETAIQSMLKLHTAQYQAKQITQATKGAEQEVKTELKKLETLVDKVLTKTNRTAQPISLEGVEGTHKIVKKTSARSEKLTLTTFQEFLMEALEQLQLGDSDEAAWQAFERQRASLIKLLLLRINSMPKKEATNIKLVSKLAADTMEQDSEETK